MAAVWKSDSTKKILLLMSDLFSQLYVEDVDTSGNKIPYKVPVRIATSMSLVEFWRKPTDSTRFTLPIISIWPTAMDYSESRNRRPFDNIISNTTHTKILNPVAYDYNIDVGIMTKTPGQIFEIVEQLVPAYRSARYYPLIEFVFTDGTKLIRDIPVHISSANIQVQEEISDGRDVVYQADITFKVGGWIYGPEIYQGASNQYLEAVVGSPTPVPLIQNIDISFMESINAKFEDLIINIGTGNQIHSQIVSSI